MKTLFISDKLTEMSVKGYQQFQLLLHCCNALRPGFFAKSCKTKSAKKNNSFLHSLSLEKSTHKRSKEHPLARGRKWALRSVRGSKLWTFRVDFFFHAIFPRLPDNSSGFIIKIWRISVSGNPLLPIKGGVEFPQIKIPSVVITVIREKWVHFHNHYLVKGIIILFSSFLFFSSKNINLNVTETMATVCGNRYLIFDTRVSFVLSDCIVLCLLEKRQPRSVFIL